MNILVITHRPPFPQNGGYPIVISNTIKGFVEMGHHVSLFSLNPKKSQAHVAEAAREEWVSRINYQVCPVDISTTFSRAVLDVLSSRAGNIERFYTPEFERMLITELKVRAYDIVQFEGLFISAYLPAIRRNTKARLIYRAHHIEQRVWERLARQKQDPFKRFYLYIVARRIKRYEVQQFSSYDAIAAFTRQDKRTMLNYGSKAPIAVLPVGVNIGDYQPDPSLTEFPSLFFLGSLDWMPNREGIEWFLENFHTQLTNDDLRVRFYVAGNDIPERFDDYEVMGKIYIQGEVDNALEFVNSKAIMIVPLLSGGGMRVKIVEGMAMQKCIISTSLGAEGIEFEHGVNILIANDREEFARAIKHCIADEGYCRRIGENARKLVEARHNSRTVTQNMAAFYQQVLSGQALR